MRKLLLFALSFFLLFSSFDTSPAYSASSCQYLFKNPLTAKSGVGGVSLKIDLTVNTNGALAKSNSSSYKLSFTGSAFAYGPHSAPPAPISISTDSNGNILYNGSLTLTTGDLTVSVVNSSNTSSIACNPQTYKVQEATNGARCIVNVTVANNIPTIKVIQNSFINISNDSLKVEIKDSTGQNYNIKSGSEQCFSKNTLVNPGITADNSISLSAGTYAATVMDGCFIFSPACSVDFTVDASGNGGGSSAATECYYCPSGLTYQDGTPPKCVTGSSTVDVSSAGYCNSCDPNHALGCLDFDQSGNPINFNQVPPPCSDPTCPNINTAFGNISTKPEGFITSLLSLILGVSGGILVLLIIISGYRLITSQGDADKIKEAREQLTSAFVGLLFIIFSLVFLETIILDVLKLPVTFGG